MNGWVNNREAGDLRRHRARYDVIVMNQGCNAYVIIIQNETTRECIAHAIIIRNTKQGQVEPIV